MSSHILLFLMASLCPISEAFSRGQSMGKESRRYPLISGHVLSPSSHSNHTLQWKLMCSDFAIFLTRGPQQTLICKGKKKV